MAEAAEAGIVGQGAPKDPTDKEKPEAAQKPLSGAALGGVVSTILSLAADFAKPVGDYATLLLVVSVVMLACSLIIRWKLTNHHIVVTTWQFSAVCTIVFMVVVVGQALVPKAERSRGIAAAELPVIASVQAHVLPLTPAQRELFDLEDALKSQDLGRRLAAATAAMSSDEPIKQAAIDLIFSSSDNTLKAVALEEAMKAKLNNDIEFVVPETAQDNPLAEAVRATRFHVSNVSPDGRSFSGSLPILGWRSDRRGHSEQPRHLDHRQHVHVR